MLLLCLEKMIKFIHYRSHFCSSTFALICAPLRLLVNPPTWYAMADIFINFIYLNGEESILSFPRNFTFNDLNRYNDSYISLCHIGDFVFIDKCVLLSNYSDQTIHVIKKQRDTLLPWIDRLINTDDVNCGQVFGIFSENKNAILILEQNIDKINWRALSGNINAISILEKNIHNINWFALSGNINAIPLLEKHIEKINWSALSSNINAIPLLEQNIDKINWNALSANPSAILLLEQHFNKINWRMLSCNINAILLLEQNIDKINWVCLSQNINAISILEKHIDKIDWNALSRNINAIPLLEQHIDKINWNVLSGNINAISLLKKNIDKIDRVDLRGNINAILILETHIDEIHWNALTRDIYTISKEGNIQIIDLSELSCNKNANAISLLTQIIDKFECDWVDFDILYWVIDMFTNEFIFE